MRTNGEYVMTEYAKSWFAAFIIIFALCLLLKICFWAGWDSGATAIASGQYKASLIAKPDKTTYWKFEETK